MRFIMTPQLAQDIFEEWPVVLQAFRDNVPGKVRVFHPPYLLE